MLVGRCLHHEGMQCDVGAVDVVDADGAVGSCGETRVMN